MLSQNPNAASVINVLSYDSSSYLISYPLVPIHLDWVFEWTLNMPPSSVF